MDKTWNTDDIDFDSKGRLVIKNGQLIDIINQKMAEKNEVEIITYHPIPVGPPPPPDGMCGCVARMRPNMPGM